MTWYSRDLGGVARHRPRLRLRQGRRLRAELAAGQVAGQRPRRQHGPLHAGDLAPPPVQLRRARQRPGGRPVLGPALRGRRRAGGQRPRPRLRAVRAPGPGRRREQRPGGLREIVVGTGGAVLRGFKATVPRTASSATPPVWGVLRLTLHPTQLRLGVPARRPERIADSGSDALPLTGGVTRPPRRPRPLDTADRMAEHARAVDHRRRRRRDVDRLPPRRARLDATSSSSTGRS